MDDFEDDRNGAAYLHEDEDEDGFGQFGFCSECGGELCYCGLCHTCEDITAPDEN